MKYALRSSTRLKAVIFLLLALAGAAAAHLWTPRIHLSDLRGTPDLESLFPKAFGPWKIDEHAALPLISPDAQELLSKLYNQTISRTYINANGQRIMLSVAYGGDQSDGTSAHRPEVCYPAQGFELLVARNREITLAGTQFPVREMVAKQNRRVEPITYWVVVGDSIALTGTEQKISQLKYSLRGIVPDGLLVRVSNITQDVEAGFKLHNEFMHDLQAGMAAKDSSRVFGALGKAGQSAGL